MTGGGFLIDDPQIAAWISLIAAGPLLLLGALYDLRQMRIPNWLNGALALVFLATALAVHPLEEIGWRIAGALLVLVVGFGFFSLGRMGGGDVKMLAACALFVPVVHAGLVLQLLAVGLALGLGLIHLGRLAVGGRETRWRGLRKGARFPMGVAIGGAMTAYLGLVAAFNA